MPALLLPRAGPVVSQQQPLREVRGARHELDTDYLRTVLGKQCQKPHDDPAAPRGLKTKPGVGYRFLEGGPQKATLLLNAPRATRALLAI